MTLQTDLETAVAQVTGDSQKLKDIVNGDAATVVTVDSGPVKSVAKAIAEIGDTSNQAIKDLSNVVDADFSAKATSAGVGTGDMVAANNLSDVADTATAKTNLGLGTAAVENVAAGGIGDLLRADGDGSILTGIQTTDDVARTNIVLNAFRIAVNGGLSVQNMVDGVVDEFEDETGVDTGASTNETHDATGGCYAPTITSYTVDQVPTMTSNTAPSGTVSASSYWGGGLEPWRAFADDGTTSYWEAGSGTGVPGWLAYDFGANKVIRRYTVQVGTAPSGYDPTAWSFEGWSGSGWDVLDTQSGLTWSTNEIKTFNINNTTAYQKYRVYVTALNGGGSPSIKEMEMMEAASIGNMTLISNATTAEAQPDEAFIVLWQEDVDPVILNTDIKAWASRDGGATWAAITLAQEASLSTGRILTGTADISGQPAGTAMVWKITTHNTKEQRLHGVGLEWS